MNTLLWIVAALAGMVVLAGVAVLALAWTPDRPLADLRKRWASPPSQFVEISGLQVHVRDEGPRDDPSPLVLIHGTGSSLHTWDGWTATLRERRRVVRFDLPGFGLTGPGLGGNYSMASYARFVAAFLDALHIPHCVLVGNSLGGYVAWTTALAQPTRIDKLILLDSLGYPVPPAGNLGFVIASTPLIRNLMEYVLPRGLIAASVRGAYGDPARVTPGLVDRYYELMLRPGNRRALVQRMQQVSPEGEQAGRIKELRLPTLILWGGRDKLNPPANAERFHQDIAGSQVVMFDDVGHVPHEEDPARTVAAVKTFLGLR